MSTELATEEWSSGKTATYVKTLQGWKGDARLYLLDPPMLGDRYVIVSAVDAWDHGPETYVFSSDSEGGTPKGFLEREGSFEGGMDHEQALANTGYTVTNPEVTA